MGRYGEDDRKHQDNRTHEKKIKFIYVFLSYSAISEHHIFEKSNNTLFWGHIAHREHSRKSFKHKPSRPQHAFGLK